jgi:hypothetical protein
VALVVDHDAVRAVIDTSLTEDVLPDATISLSAFAGAALSYVEARDPEAQTRTGDEATRLNRAVVYLTAAHLLPSVPQLVSEKLGPVSTTRLATNWQERAADLRLRADEEIQAVLDADARAPSRPTVFTTARGTRWRT